MTADLPGGISGQLPRIENGCDRRYSSCGADGMSVNFSSANEPLQGRLRCVGQVPRIGRGTSQL